VAGIVHFKTHNKLNLELDVLDIRVPCSYTGLFKMIVGVLTTCHTQYT